MLTKACRLSVDLDQGWTRSGSSLGRLNFRQPVERGEIGPELFRAACPMGVEGLVSKHRERPYQAGRSKYWIKAKNWMHPGMYRVMDALA